MKLYIAKTALLWIGGFVLPQMRLEIERNAYPVLPLDCKKYRNMV